METLLETIDLDIEESSELLFKVRIEGLDAAPAKVRLVCEAGDVAYMFTGRPTGQDSMIQFVLPSLKDKVKEGSYPSRVEVLVENRYFSPVQFNLKFKKAVSVVAEAVQVVRTRVPEVKVTAEAVVKKAPLVTEATVTALDVKSPAPIRARSAPPPARVKAAMTLKERYASRINAEERTDVVDEHSKELIKQLARSFTQR